MGDICQARASQMRTEVSPLGCKPVSIRFLHLIKIALDYSLIVWMGRGSGK